MIPVLTNSKDIVKIRELDLEGSSECVIGRNVTAQCSIQHHDKNSLVFKHDDSSIGLITYVSHEHHCNIALMVFTLATSSQVVSSLSLKLKFDDWPALKPVNDQVHNHT